MTESDEFLVATMAYCLSWELAGARANQSWSVIRDYLDNSPELTDTERWMCELYEESSPTAQEERSILSRLNARILNPQAGIAYRKSILSLLPEALAESAGQHRLIHSLSMQEETGLLRSWLAQYKITTSSPSQSSPLPLAAREADFLQFLEFPSFSVGFRRYWHQAPKYRNNQQTRLLLCVSAAFCQMVACEDASALQAWTERLSRICNYTEQTQTDVYDISLLMLDESYDAQELGYRLFVDAKEVDRNNIIKFCNRYADDLTGFARDLLRGMQLAL
jgi:hypothetical protein